MSDRPSGRAPHLRALSVLAETVDDLQNQGYSTEEISLALGCVVGSCGLLASPHFADGVACGEGAYLAYEVTEAHKAMN